jgi:hypothetical protein
MNPKLRLVQSDHVEIPAFKFKPTANKSHDSTDVGTVSDR